MHIKWNLLSGIVEIGKCLLYAGSNYFWIPTIDFPGRLSDLFIVCWIFLQCSVFVYKHYQSIKKHKTDLKMQKHIICQKQSEHNWTQTKMKKTARVIAILFLDSKKCYEKYMFISINIRELHFDKEWLSPIVVKIINSYKKVRIEIK